MKTPNSLPPFIYHPDRSFDVYELSKHYIKDTGTDTEISKYGFIYQAAGDLIPHPTESFWSGHFFPWIESWEEIQISMNLCMLGFYKQAMVSLRSGFELGLLSVYWNLNDDGHIAVKEWLRSDTDTPRMKGIWGKLIQHHNFKRFQQEYDLQKRLLSLGYLHNYVHTKGHKFSNRMGLLKSNWQTFEEKAFHLWLASFKEVIEILAICHLVKYPLGTVQFDYESKFGIDIPMLGGLNPNQIEKLKELIGNTIFSQIKELAKDDPHANEIISWVSNLPDITDDEIDSQLIESDKHLIEDWGLTKWLEYQGQFAENGKISKRQKHRTAILTVWANQHGFIESRSKREGCGGEGTGNAK